ncbi:MAG: hypothetical protein RBT49_14320 [Bacteroidales bacterium]|jgi:hypothetical protein|nr:hypothetical protein [Bacteroidales bacterium]
MNSILDTLDNYTNESKVNKIFELYQDTNMIPYAIVLKELDSVITQPSVYNHYLDKLLNEMTSNEFFITSLLYLKNHMKSYKDSISNEFLQDFNSHAYSLYKDLTKNDTLRCFSLGQLIYDPSNATFINLKNELISELSNSNTNMRNAAIKTIGKHLENLYDENDYVILRTKLISLIDSRKNDIDEISSAIILLSKITDKSVVTYLDELLKEQNLENPVENEEYVNLLIYAKSMNFSRIFNQSLTNYSIDEKFISIFNNINQSNLTTTLEHSILHYINENQKEIETLRTSELIDNKIAYLKAIRIQKKAFDTVEDKEFISNILDGSDENLKINAIQSMPYLYEFDEIQDILTNKRKNESSAVIRDIIGHFIGYKGGE